MIRQNGWKMLSESFKLVLQQTIFTILLIRATESLIATENNAIDDSFALEQNQTSRHGRCKRQNDVFFLPFCI